MLAFLGCIVKGILVILGIILVCYIGGGMQANPILFIIPIGFVVAFLVIVIQEWFAQTPAEKRAAEERKRKKVEAKEQKRMRAAAYKELKHSRAK